MDMKAVVLQELFPTAQHLSVLQKLSKVLVMTELANSAFGWTQPWFPSLPVFIAG